MAKHRRFLVHIDRNPNVLVLGTGLPVCALPLVLLDLQGEERPRREGPKNSQGCHKYLQVLLLYLSHYLRMVHIEGLLHSSTRFRWKRLIG